MKTLAFLVVVAIGLVASPAHAKKAHVDDAREKAFETEVENMDIYEMEGTREVSREEQRKQEALTRQTAQELADTRAKKKDVQKRTTREIASSETRRKDAEKSQRRDEAIKAKLDKDIASLEAESERIETKAKIAEDNAQKAQLALEEARRVKQETIKRKELALETKAKHEAQIRDLVAERKKVAGETTQLERVTVNVEHMTNQTGQQAEKATVALELAKDKRKTSQAIHDSNENELDKTKDDLYSIDKELKKNISETNKLNDKIRKQRLELEKRKAIISQQRQQLVVLKNRKQQAEVEYSEVEVRLRKVSDNLRKPASKTF